MSQPKSPTDRRETVVRVTANNTHISTERVKGSTIELFSARPMTVGIRNTGSAPRRVIIDWDGVGTEEYMLEAHSQIVVDARSHHGTLAGEHPVTTN